MGNCYCLKNSPFQNKSVFDLEDNCNSKEVANPLNESYPEYETNAQKKGNSSLRDISKTKISQNENIKYTSDNNYNNKGIESYVDKKKPATEYLGFTKDEQANKKIAGDKLEDTSDKMNNLDTITSLYNGTQQHSSDKNKVIASKDNEKNNNKSCNKSAIGEVNENMNGNNSIDTNSNNNKNINSEMILKTASMKRNPSLSKRLTEILKLKDISKNLKDKGNSINILLLGDKCVGKTSIVYQYISNKFDQYYIQTIIKEEFTKIIPVNGKKYNINFTVTSGVREYQEDYTNLYKVSDFFVVCYDITSSASFDKAKEIITKEIIPYVFLYNDGYANVILVGNKCDLKERAVDHQKVKEYCDKYSIDLYETSAKLKTNIAKIFNKIVCVYDEAIYGNVKE